jgi:DNA-directed RNA polymerase specialized sigma24 family protein
VTGFRRQAASLPPQPSNLTLSAQAYAAGDTHQGERLFHAAFIDAAPLVRMVIHRHLSGVEDREDAFQVAMLNIWRSVQRGEDPAITPRARGAAVSHLRRDRVQAGHGDRLGWRAVQRGETPPVPRERVPVEGVLSEMSTPDHADETLDAIEVQRIAATLGMLRPIWGEIVQQLAAGLSQAEAARELGRPKGTITRNVSEIRTHLEREEGAA